MKSLKEFLNPHAGSSASTDIAFRNVSNGIAKVVFETGAVNSKSKADEFGREVTKLATSDEVILELSEVVGTPLPNESEDEFVERAKQSFKKILMAKLSGK
ncbi:hypothetical protein K6U58_03520 [Vibrio fluvialis]|uniref:hypothetical protein n=1 Tax=Vibrio fluvialis TaxID=676 RepID=UPI00057118F5|nr:hypothetical protein [Vibrio fluvialis]MBY8243605.1 hypothetical protein [Vibrio fluvialis]MCG6357663.1 hypothetical protein [Vibrio fluvialis]